MTQKFWFISFAELGDDDEAIGYGNCVIDQSPAQWAYESRAEPKGLRGMPVILYAEEIPQADYLEQRDQW